MRNSESNSDSILIPDSNSSLIDVAARSARASDRRIAAPSRHRTEGRAASGVSLLKTPREQTDRLVRRGSRRQGAGDLLLGLQQHHRHRPLHVLQQRRPRPPADLRRRRAAERVGHREDARVPRRLPRADGCALAAAGHRPGRPQDQEPAGARRPAASRKSSSPPIRTWKARRRRSTWRACSSRSASRSRASRWAFPSAAISTTPTRSPCTKRSKADARSDGT